MRFKSVIISFVLLTMALNIQAQQSSIVEWMQNINATNLYHLKKYCDNNAEQCFLNPDSWIKWKDIQGHVPSKFINANSLSNGLERTFADFKQSFFIKIIEEFTV